MRQLSVTAVIVVVAILLAGCGPQIYMSPDFETYRADHSTAAILPFEVIIDPNKLPKDYTLDMKRDAENAEAYNFQNELYMQFLKRHEKGEYTIEFQDISKTNALLMKNGITNENLGQMTVEELHRILGASVLISGSIHRSKPMSTGAAVVIGALFGVWGSTNEVNVSLNLHNGTDGTLLWKYDHQASGSVGSSSEKLAENLMKNVSKKFPYKTEKEPSQFTSPYSRRSG